MEEFAIYALVAGAVIAAVFSISALKGGYSSPSGVESGWGRLPPIFKMLWGFSLLFEETLGAALASAMPESAKRYARLGKTAALPLTGARVLACMFLSATAMAFLGAAIALGGYFMFPGLGIVIPVSILSIFMVMGWFWPSQALAQCAELRQEEIARQLPLRLT